VLRNKEHKVAFNFPLAIFQENDRVLLFAKIVWAALQHAQLKLLLHVNIILQRKLNSNPK
jgi:hypothetical protein